jgi:hypothetical protein
LNVYSRQTAIIGPIRGKASIARLFFSFSVAQNVVASVNLALPGANGPGIALRPVRGSATAEPASQTAAGTPVAVPLPQEPPPVRDPAAAEPALQSAAETPVEAPASVAPLPPHRPPQSLKIF